MSVEAITWALRQPIQHSSAKFVLVVLANCASAENAHAFPSVAYLSAATGQDRKTVTTNLQRLQEWGLIEDTTKRVGATKQIIVYRLICGPDLFQPGEEKRNSSENGTVPKTEGKTPVFPLKDPQKRDTEPSLTQRKQREERAPAGTRLPLGWEPTEADREFARTEQPGMDVEAEILKFRDYWHAKPGAKGQSADWSATWRTWIRRADPPRAGATQPPATPAASRDWRAPSETPLENDLAYIRHQHAMGVYGEGPDADRERDRLLEAARQRHGAKLEAEPV